MKSIIHNEDCCYVCNNPNAQLHHIYFGAKNRRISDENGFVVNLCRKHHTGEISPHKDRDIDLQLKKICQMAYEEKHSREEFIKLIGRSYL